MRRAALPGAAGRRGWLSCLLIVYVALAVVIMHTHPAMSASSPSATAMSMLLAPLPPAAGPQQPHPPARPHPCELGGQRCLPAPPSTARFGELAPVGFAVCTLVFAFAGPALLAIRQQRRRHHRPPDLALLCLLRV